jgi:hypothetical protein
MQRPNFHVRSRFMASNKQVGNIASMLLHTCSNLAALAFLMRYQRYLSLRVLVLQPLVITLIMLASTAALVREACIC